MGRGLALAVLISLLLMLSSGCAKTDGDDSVIATVNGEAVYLKDLKRELTIRARQEPGIDIDENFLDNISDTLIKKRIIIQEAMDKNMTQESRFVDTIKSFWEQTLIRDFIEYKTEEFDRYVFVTDKEIKDHYDALKGENASLPPLEDVYEQVRERIRLIKKSQSFEKWLDKERKNSKIEINKSLIHEQAVR